MWGGAHTDALPLGPARIGLDGRLAAGRLGMDGSAQGTGGHAPSYAHKAPGPRLESVPPQWHDARRETQLPHLTQTLQPMTLC